MLAAAPTPAAAAKLTRGRVVALLKRSGRGNHPALVEQILADLHTPALRQPPRVEQALGHTVAGLIGIVVAMGQAVDDLETELAREFDQHPQAAILRSAPGLGPILAAREIGDDPARFKRPEQSARVRRHRAGDHRVRTLALRQGPQGPQQTSRRRIPRQ